MTWLDDIQQTWIPDGKPALNYNEQDIHKLIQAVRMAEESLKAIVAMEKSYVTADEYGRGAISAYQHVGDAARLMLSRLQSGNFEEDETK